MKILMIKTDPPYPLESGTDWVSYHLLRTLASDHEITYATLTRPGRSGETIQELEKYCSEVISVERPNVKSLLHRVFYKSLFLILPALTGIPGVVWYSTPRALRRRISDLLSRHSFDMIHVEYWYAAPYARLARRGHRVLLKHDVAYRADARLLAHQSPGPAKWWAQIRQSRLKRAELSQCRHFNTVLTLTDADRDFLREVLGDGPEIRSLPTLVLPFAETPSGRQEDRRLLFLGHLRRRTVMDSVVYFCDEILPRVRQELPGTIFEIVGGDEERAAFLASRPGIELTGFVRDVAACLGRATVMVVPLRAGSGIKLKILQAMAAGVPVVTTSIGAEGIGVIHDREVMIADDSEQFARCTVQLLNDPERRRRMGELGRQFVRERFASDNARREVLEFYSGQFSKSGGGRRMQPDLGATCAAPPQ